ncbi:MAG: hypothetical protein II670_08965 [Alphaproteobacteria bacterium]|nr:hypothetical protein [Alphaproteobacteria bacterium]
MNKYIDADLLRKDIEKHIKEVKDAAERFAPNMGFFDAKLSGIYDVMAIIDSLQQELPKVDLEKEIDNFLNETGAPYIWCNDDEQKEWCSIIARYFWNKGYDARNK